MKFPAQQLLLLCYFIPYEIKRKYLKINFKISMSIWVFLVTTWWNLNTVSVIKDWHFIWSPCHRVGVKTQAQTQTCTLKYDLHTCLDYRHQRYQAV